MVNHELSTILEHGFVEMNVAASVSMPTLAEVQRLKVHAYFRLTDGLWHRFRYTDAAKAKQFDTALAGPMLA